MLNEEISQCGHSNALWDADLKQKNEKDTWLKLTLDFEGTVCLQSEKHMCEEETKVSVGEHFMHKQRKSHVYNVETKLKPRVRLLGDTFPKIINFLHTQSSDVCSFPLCCSSELLGNLNCSSKQ